MAIDRKTVEHVARLAQLELDEKDLALYEKQLGAVLDYIAKLDQLDLTAVEPLVHAAESSNVFRKDEPRPCLDRPEALRNAPERNEGFFIVPKVVE